MAFLVTGAATAARIGIMQALKAAAQQALKTGLSAATRAGSAASKLSNVARGAKTATNIAKEGATVGSGYILVDQY